MINSKWAKIKTNPNHKDVSIHTNRLKYIIHILTTYELFGPQNNQKFIMCSLTFIHREF